MSDTTGQNSTLARIQAGMAVLDRNGEGIGTVSMVRMGDPSAVTGQGQGHGGGGGPLETIARAFGAGDDVPRQFAEKLLRTGYLKVDRPGVLGGHVYVPADEVVAVQGTTVRLSSSQDSLVHED
jgi:hypothetical protein